jgi:20S proteasome alpha/beta subunit
MTLLVGIRCKDGVVVAADQTVTFGVSPGNFTIAHKAQKVRVVSKSLIVAGTGHVGGAQRFVETTQRTWDQVAGANKNNSPMDICRHLSAAFIKDCQGTGMQKPSLGALVAFPSTKGGGPQLCEFQTSDFQPELKDAGCWFVSMGSGQIIADSYLAFMRDAFWKDGMPNLKEGVFAAAWVMRQSIRVAPGFIDEPIDIAVLQKDAAKMLDQGELAYLMDVADQATKHFGTFDPENLSPGTQQEPPVAAPPIPEPPPAK